MMENQERIRDLIEEFKILKELEDLGIFEPHELDQKREHVKSTIKALLEGDRGVAA